MTHPSGSSDPSGPDRRSVLRTAALGGVALPLLSACGGSGGGASASDSGSSGSSSGSSGASGGGSGSTVPTSDVPVGGGVILADAKAVVTQPTAGDFKAFTAICTHAGCPVGEVTDGQIVCPCHGSRFSIDDGSVEQGPATSPLAAVPFSVKGDQVVLG